MEGSTLDQPNVVDRVVFTFSLNHELQKAIRLRYPLSLLCLTPDRPGAEITSPLIHRLAALIASRVRATDLTACLDPSTVVILFVDAEATNLSGILGRLKEDLELGLRLTVSGGGACYPETASSGVELLRQAIELMRGAKAEGGNRLYLPSN